MGRQPKLFVTYLFLPVSAKAEDLFCLSSSEPLLQADRFLWLRPPLNQRRLPHISHYRRRAHLSSCYLAV